jgi:hypothetical protein
MSVVVALASVVLVVGSVNEILLRTVEVVVPVTMTVCVAWVTVAKTVISDSVVVMLLITEASAVAVVCPSEFSCVRAPFQLCVIATVLFVLSV